jgi:hypothetical protein
MNGTTQSQNRTPVDPKSQNVTLLNQAIQPFSLIAMMAQNLTLIA